MSTLKQYVREAVRIGGQSVGRTETISSLTTTTVVVAALGQGGETEQKYRDRYIARLDTASTADLFRRCTGFTSSSGTLTHAGTNYADTTATSESVDILEYEPHILLEGIQWALTRLWRVDKTIIPSSNARRVWLDPAIFTWLTRRSQVRKVTYRSWPLLTRNDSFEKWNSISTGGIVTPDHWTLAGASATMARSTSGVRNGVYSVAVTRSGANATLTQTIGLLDDGSGANSLQGGIVIAYLGGTPTAASQLRVTANDDVSTDTSSAYLADGAYGYVETAAHTVDAAATTLTVYVEINGTDGAPTIDRCGLLYGGTVDDTHWNSFTGDGEEVAVQWNEQTAPLSFTVAPRGFGGQYVIHSLRNWPEFDPTRFKAGTAMADSHDAPLTAVATGAVFYLFDTLKGMTKRFALEDIAHHARMAEEWGGKWNAINGAQIQKEQPAHGGIELVRPGRSYAVTRRW